MVGLYVSRLNSRIEYIARFLELEFFSTPVTLFTERAEFEQWQGHKINYSGEAIPGIFRIEPFGILEQLSIEPQPTDCFIFNGRKAFFATSGDYPFDILGAIFYLITRYEEYLPHTSDEHGRFSHASSLAFREEFLDQPLINYWLRDLESFLVQKYSFDCFRHKKFNCLVTYDIDTAFAYAHKPLWQNLGGTVRDILNKRWGLVRERWEVLFNKERDPYNIYEWLDAIHLYCRTPAYLFFLMAQKVKHVDRNISPDNKAFQRLIEYYSKQQHRVGLHPSWQSNQKFSTLKSEKEILEVFAEKNVIYSRQHYLLMELPATYRNLVSLGIEKDFSLGYANVNGFRASICSSFYWYDLKAETTTPLLLYPFCFMDATSYYHLQQSPGAAYHELIRYYETVKQLNGLMVSVWHNSLLSTSVAFKGWREMYEIFMKQTVYWDAYSSGNW